MTAEKLRFLPLRLPWMVWRGAMPYEVGRVCEERLLTPYERGLLDALKMIELEARRHGVYTEEVRDVVETFRRLILRGRAPTLRRLALRLRKPRRRRRPSIHRHWIG